MPQKKYEVGRNAIYYWVAKYATLDQRKKAVAKKDEIKKLKDEIERLQFIKDFQQEYIAELELETGIDKAKKSLPGSLADDIVKKKQDILKQNGSANASGYQGKHSTKG